MPPKEIIRGVAGASDSLVSVRGNAIGLMATLWEESNGLSHRHGQTSLIVGPVRAKGEGVMALGPNLFHKSVYTCSLVIL